MMEGNVIVCQVRSVARGLERRAIVSYLKTQPRDEVARFNLRAGGRRWEKAEPFLQDERDKLAQQLRAELDMERRRLVARKPTIFEEAYRKARLEETMDLQKLEHQLRALLARRELEELKNTTHRQLLIRHAQDKEKLVLGLRRSLGRGAEHSMSGLREELLREAQEKRERALKEAETMLEQACQALRRQWDRSTQSKIDAMAQEAAIAKESAIVELRNSEALAAEEDYARALADIERESSEWEAELRGELQTEASISINDAIETCTAMHKRAQVEATSRASEAFKHAMATAAGVEDERTRSALEREQRLQEDRVSSSVVAMEKALRSCSLQNLAKRSKPPPVENYASSYEHNAGSAVKMGGIAQDLEGMAIAAEQEYFKRARAIVRLRATAALRRRDCGTGGTSEVAETSMAYRQGKVIPGASRRVIGISRGSGEEDLLDCNSCTAMFEANERLLEEARSRGL